MASSNRSKNRFRYLLRFCTEIVVFVPFICGCATITSKIGGYDAPPQIGHPYSGLSLYRLSWCLFKSDEYRESNTLFKILFPAWFLLVATIDVPLSFAADTLFLPIDLSINPAYERMSLANECGKNNSPKEFTPRQYTQKEIENSWEPYRIRKDVGQ